MENPSDIKKVLDMVRETALSIRELEKSALEDLHGQGDKDSHRFKMMEKCELLAELAEHAEPYLKGDGPNHRAAAPGAQRLRPARRHGPLTWRASSSCPPCCTPMITRTATPTIWSGSYCASKALALSSFARRLGPVPISE